MEVDHREKAFEGFSLFLMRIFHSAKPRLCSLMSTLQTWQLYLHIYIYRFIIKFVFTNMIAPCTYKFLTKKNPEYLDYISKLYVSVDLWCVKSQRFSHWTWCLLIWLEWPASPRILLTLLLHHWKYRYTVPSTQILATELKSSCLQGKYSSTWTIFPGF